MEVDINEFSEAELREGKKLDLTLEPVGHGSIQISLKILPTVIPMRSSMNDTARRSEVLNGDIRD